MMNYFRVSGTG